MKPFEIVRLNAHTCPMTATERRILEGAGRLIEVEQLSECADLSRIAAVQIVSSYLQAPELERLTSCRIVSRLGNGCDKIDLAAAAIRGIIVANVPDSFTAEVADHTMALMLAGLRRLPVMERLARSGRRPEDVGGIRRIADLTLGIVGFGKIGRLTARRAAAFGMRIIVSDPALTAEVAAEYGVEAVDLDTLTETSDAIVLLCPLLPATRRMFDAGRLARLKPGAVFINTARGELVDETALARELENGRISFAGIDVFGETNVFSEGGFPVMHPLFRAPNTMLTPHVSANSIESREETLRRAAEATAGLLCDGRYPVNIVNRSELIAAGKLNL